MRRAPALLAFALGLAAADCGYADEHTARRTIEVGGRTRVYLLHVPPGVAKPAPLVVALHGGGGTAASAERMARFTELSDRDKFIVAYPEATNRNWNDGREAESIRSQKDAVDDGAFIAAMLEAIGKDHAVDPRRVFASGISNGGIFSHYLGAKLASRFAAIAPVCGGLAEPISKQFKPERPVSVLVIQGTADPLVPFDGGEIARGGRGRIVPTREAVRLWVQANGCGEKPATDALPDRDPSDGCTVKRERWTGGRDGTEVVLLTVVGGGHCWPSGQQYLPKLLIGPVYRDIDTETIWSFLKERPRPR